MVEYNVLEKKIKTGDINNCYIFCGVDEALMKDTIKLIVGKTVSDSFKDLNYIQFDGNTADMEVVVNTCDTIPMMSDKKVVVVYRASFLGDGEDKEQNKRFEKLNKYIENIPDYCVLIVYHVFENDREKPSNKIKKLEKKTIVSKFDKLRGVNLEKRIKALFDERKKEIGKVELKLFCEGVDSNMNIIENEVDKLCSYTFERQITKEDVLIMQPPKADSDIFDLVDSLSQKKIEKALDILNELLYKGEKIPAILFMIERQFNLLFNIKLGVEKGKNKDTLVSELKMNPYICEKMMVQSKRFGLSQLKNALQLCINAEERIKSSSSDNKTEMELLIINTIVS